MYRRLLAFIPIDEEFIRPGYITRGSERPEAAIRALAYALAASPIWAAMPDLLLVVRSAPRPMLGIFGDLSEAAEARVAALPWQLKDTLSRLRYVSYAQAEQDCAQLAAKLVNRVGRDQLRRFRFDAIPRGGLIVLGMLSYLLKLERTQLEPPHPPDVPLVVVDDCALSGARLGRYLERCENHQIVFAHLYSHPDLRRAIEAQEPRVLACLSAQDLRDHGPERLGDKYALWRQLWLNRLEGPRYWVGLPDHICFAWNEPDHGFWNPVTGRLEDAWHVVAPELCLKNRPLPGAETIDVQVQPEGKGPLKPSAQVLFGEVKGEVVIGNVEVGKSFKLDRAAADIWRHIVEHGNLDDVAVALLNKYDADEATLKRDLHAFAAELLAQGLLERSDGPTPDR